MGFPRTALFSSLLLLTTLLSGCAFEQGPDGQSAVGPGTVSYQGSSTGTQTSKPLSCDGGGKVNVNYQGSGDLTVVVRDGDGVSVHRRSYSVDGQGSDTDGVQGASGGWTVTVERGGDSGGGILPGYGGGYDGRGDGFSGQYNVNIVC